MYAQKVQGSTARWGRISMTLYGRTVQFGPSICDTSTSIVVTVRYFARSSAPHGEYKRCKSLVRTTGCGILPLVSGWRCAQVCTINVHLVSVFTCPKRLYRALAGLLGTFVGLWATIRKPGLFFEKKNLRIDPLRGESPCIEVSDRPNTELF